MLFSDTWCFTVNSSYMSLMKMIHERPWGVSSSPLKRSGAGVPHRLCVNVFGSNCIWELKRSSTLFHPNRGHPTGVSRRHSPLGSSLSSFSFPFRASINNSPGRSYRWHLLPFLFPSLVLSRKLLMTSWWKSSLTNDRGRDRGRWGLSFYHKTVLSLWNSSRTERLQGRWLSLPEDTDTQRTWGKLFRRLNGNRESFCKVVLSLMSIC